MADQEKTEKPTSKRRGQARKKGNVARSSELPAAVGLIGCVLFLMLAGGGIAQKVIETYMHFFSKVGQTSLTQEGIFNLLMSVFGKIFYIIGPLLICLALMALIINFVQVGFLFNTQALKPKLSKFNPIKGMKKLFSPKSLVNMLRNVVKLAIITLVAWNTIKGEWEKVLPMVGADPWTIAMHLGNVTLRIGLNTGIALLILALLDYAYEKYKHEKGLKMSKQEVKDERKQAEGDPKVKRKIRQKQMEMARMRMMAAVPEADVVITNPEHLAVALQYDNDNMSAPTVIAKGANHIAFKIREIARRHGVTIMEDKPLAQALYAAVEVNDQIPESLYKAVAEILAHVYRQKGDSRIRQSSDRGDQPGGAGSGFGTPAMGSAPWKRLRYGGLSKDR